MSASYLLNFYSYKKLLNTKFFQACPRNPVAMTCPGAVNVSYVYEKNIFIMLEINVSDFYKYNYACE